MWRKTFDAISASQGPGVLLDRRGDLLLVLGDERQQQLLDEVGDLGQPDVELATLLHLGVELLEVALQLVEPVAGHGSSQTIHDPALQVAPLATRHHIRHSATNRATGRSDPANSRRSVVAST